jgi:hypothetical protein
MGWWGKGIVGLAGREARKMERWMTRRRVVGAGGGGGRRAHATEMGVFFLERREGVFSPD